jgi:hypothetical protein
MEILKKIPLARHNICVVDMAMPKKQNLSPTERGVKTGRRETPRMEHPRDNTVCLMLSEAEKEAVDRLAFCLHLTRSGVLAKIVTEFVTAAEDSKAGRNAEKQLAAYLAESRKAVKNRGDFATKTLQTMKGK